MRDIDLRMTRIKAIRDLASFSKSKSLNVQRERERERISIPENFLQV